MAKILFPILLFLFQINIAFSQPQTKTDNSDYTRLNEVLPPSPNAASLGKFGGVNFGLSSGAMSHTIPLANLNSTNLNIPISISYNTNGFKVDEIATRVGTSWTLNAGGVITRVVRGAVDEQSRRLIPPADFPKRTRNLINFMEGIVNSDENGPHDTEHDVFSFNFLNYSGRFILDADKKPVLLTHSGIKIAQDLRATDNNFLITDPDGIRYYFGGEAATETTLKYLSGGGCGKSFHSPIPTAWYLTKIIHPNQDTIYFKYKATEYDYKAGVSQTLFSSPLNAAPNCPGRSAINCSQLQNKTCVSHYLINGVQLKEVISESGGKVKLLFTNSNDGLDSLISRIEVYKPFSDQLFKAFDFVYFNAVATRYWNNFSSDKDLINRPFLVKLVEKTSVNSVDKVYGFSYNDLNDLPPRLAFAQDHYGYFNGKGNTSLIPKPPIQEWEAYFPGAKANRDADPEYSVKGLLTKIKYPTGGEDMIIYEGHTVYQKVTSIPPDTVVSVAAQGSGNIIQTKSSRLIKIKAATAARFEIGFAYDDIIGGEHDSKHHIATVYLQNDNSGEILYRKTLTKKGSDAVHHLGLNPGNYRIIIEIRGTGSFCGAQLFFKTAAPIESYQNVYVGGVRVAKVITKDNMQGIETLKKYIYSSLQNLEKSSGAVVISPIYDHIFAKTYSCTGAPSETGIGSIPCIVGGCSYYSMYSSPQNNILIYPGSPVYYHTVIESFGEDFQNGGKEYHFLVKRDVSGNRLIGQDIVGAPYSDFSWNNGKEILQYFFRKQDSTIIPVKKIFTSYKEDPRGERKFSSYIASKRYIPECNSSDPPNETEMNAYYLMSYVHFQKWIYVDTVKTFTYDPEGQSFIA